MNSIAMVSEGSSTIPSKNPPSEPPRKSRGRGPTRGKRSEKVVSTCGHKLKVEFNDQNRRVIGPNASSFANEMGIVVRSMAPLAVKRWKDIDHTRKMPMIDRLKRNESTKELPGQIEFFRDMHFSKGKGWTTPDAENYYKKMLELHISTQNSPLKENQDSLHLTENQICNQVLGKRFGYSEPHKSLSRKMRLDDDAASLENAALRTRVKDLEDQLKN
ncbi:Uncharacterized protein Adt_47445 [Abeliophyllum distichum]|uniref:Uncharacterized protein n=1 Tax=Abeliophyllum distichum TaxID=126358 RepID=A0ABD1NU55_9LAMI